MNTQKLKTARQRRAWTQGEAANTLGVSQPYLSMLEGGSRRLTPALARKFMRAYKLDATLLPLPNVRATPPREDPQALAEHLAGLGYPGLAYLRPRVRKKNPVEVFLAVLAQDDLEARLVEALPWLLLRYWDMDTYWLATQAKQYDLQNRLGFVVSMARELSQRQTPPNEQRDRVLTELESRLERSLLAREDTLCQTSLTEPERRWLRSNRPRDAARWNLLTSWQPDAFRYALQL